jgi:hypothetical protein
MSTTSPTRIDDDVFASAKLVGPVMGRSASQQVSHWARIGRELEASGSVSHREIAQVLTGRGDYDSLTPKEQAVVRAEWSERMTQRREALDLTVTFGGEGRPYAELDDDGNVVVRGAGNENNHRA